MLKINELLNKTSSVVSSVASITLGLAVTAYATLLLKKSCRKLFSKGEVVAVVDSDKTSDKKPSPKKKPSEPKPEKTK